MEETRFSCSRAIKFIAFADCMKVVGEIFGCRCITWHRDNHNLCAESKGRRLSMYLRKAVIFDEKPFPSVVTNHDFRSQSQSMREQDLIFQLYSRQKLIFMTAYEYHTSPISALTRNLDF